MSRNTHLGHGRVLLVFLLLAPAPAFSVERWVTNKTQFTSAMAVVQPGDVIVWKGGTYDNQGTITFEPATWGTAASPITLRAETPGGVTFRGNTQLALGGQYLVVSGFRFDNSNFSFSGTSTAVWVIETRAHDELARHAYNCRVTDCAIVNYDNPAATSSSKWLEWYGATNRFDHNFVSGKRTQGALFIVELDDQTNHIEAHHTIDHNVFADRTPAPGGANEYETVRVGTSQYSDEIARVAVESNYFYQCSGEAEIISGKSCENTYRYNTFVECAGSLCLRHGRGSRVEGNVFFGNNVTNSGGIRVCNQDHVIVNNYLQDLAGTDYQAGLAIMDGTTPGSSNPDLSGSYVQVSNVVVAHNTLINAADPVNYGVGRGGSGRSQPPRDFTLAGNIIVASNSPIFTLTHTPINVTYLSNLVWGASTGLPPDPNLILANPQLAPDSFGIQRPSPSGPAAGAAATQSLFPGNLLDMDGALRPLTGRDIGADQIGLGTRPPAPMAQIDVGPSWMQAPAAPSITTQPQSQTNMVGSTVFLSVTATGIPAPSYQWRKGGTNVSDGGNISGATSSTLTISAVQLTNAGNYTVLVTNASGSVTSSVATLTINAAATNQPPTITTQPVNQTATAGQNAIFAVVAGGTAPLVYQWLFNATNFDAAATNATLVLNNVQSNNAGGYSVVVTNTYGSVTSIVATLTVNPPSGAGSFFQWDANTNAAGIQDGPGTWRANTSSNSFWTTNGGLANVAWPASNVAGEAVFGGGSSGTAGVITLVDLLAAAPTLDAMTFNAPFAGDYTIDNSGSAAGPVLADGATITVNGGNPAINSPMGGVTAASGFTKLGSGTLWLGAANTFGGIVTISGGTLVIGADSALGANPASLVTNQLTLNGGTLRVTNNVTWGTKRGLYLTANGGTIDVTAGQTLTMNGGSSAPECIAGAAGGDLTKTGGGTLWIQLTNANTYPGQTFVNAGTLALQGNNGVITIPGDLTIRTGAVFSIVTSKSGLLGAGVSVTNLGGTFVAGGTEALNCLVLGGNGLLTNGSTSSRTFSVSNTIILQSGTIVGYGTPPLDKLVLAGSAVLIKTTPGTACIVGTNSTQVNNSFTGKTTISAGILNIGFDTALGANPGSFTPDQLTMDGGTLQITNAYTWGSRRGITLTANGGTFDIPYGVSQSFPVVIAGTADGDFTKAGPGTLTLTAANSYNGDTVVNSGVLALGPSGTIGSSPIIRLARGATLDVSAAGLALGSSQTLAGSGTVVGNVTLASGAKIQPGTNTLKLTVLGNLTLNSNTVVIDLGGATLGAGGYRLLDYSGARTGSFKSIPTLLNGSTTGIATIDQSTTNQVNLAVTGTASHPSFEDVFQSGSNLVMQGAGGAAGKAFDVLSSMDISLPLAGWTTNTGGVFDGSGRFHVTNAINPAEPQRFFTIRYLFP